MLSLVFCFILLFASVILLGALIYAFSKSKRTPESCKYNGILGCTGDCAKCNIPIEQEIILK